MEDYNKIKAIRSSELDACLIGAEYVKAMREANKTGTKATSFGTMAHSFILENNEFGKLYKPEPLALPGWEYGESKNKKAYKDWKQKTADEGKQITTTEDNMKLLKMNKAIRNHSWCKENFIPESIHSVIEENRLFSIDNIDCKAKPDYRDPEKKIVVDLKTINPKTKKGELVGLTEDRLRFHIQIYKYLRQQRFYQMSGLDDYNFFLLFVENEEPFNVAVMELLKSDLLTETANIKRAIHNYKMTDIAGTEERFYTSSEVDDEQELINLI